MTEWPKVHDWKSCVLARVPRVRIPLSPHNQKHETPTELLFSLRAYSAPPGAGIGGGLTDSGIFVVFHFPRAYTPAYATALTTFVTATHWNSVIRVAANAPTATMQTGG